MKYRSFPDLTDQIFGKVKVINGNLPNRKAQIKCECGTIKIVSKYDVFQGKIQSCGAKLCSSRGKKLIGNKFSLLTVLKEAEEYKDITGGCVQWVCQCECGNYITVPSNQLIAGRTKSCGCEKNKWISEKNSIPIKNRVENQLFTGYKRNADSRNYSFELTKEQFVSFLYNECYYCGAGPSNCMTKIKITGEEKHYFNGIDRVNNENGYTIDNCVSCCKLCNHAKKDMSKECFLSLAKKIVEKNNV